jgi:hypothetical protein
LLVLSDIKSQYLNKDTSMNRLIPLFPLLLVSTTYAAKWDKANNPSYFDVIVQRKMIPKLSELPQEASLKDDRFGWSDSYWPSQLGGIAYRWNHPQPTPFKYKFHSKEEILAMSKQQLEELSPAELYDISQADYKYTLTKKVLSTYSPKDLWWEGICHGWALAASNYAEPDKTLVTNKDGVQVPFGASDVKALLSMHDAFNSKGIYARIGARCSVLGKVPGEAKAGDFMTAMPNDKDAARPECAGVNAGAFHIVLSNMIGIHSKGFVADVDRFNDVWNQPIVAYESKIQEELPVSADELKNGIFSRLRIVTIMTYADELEFYSPESELEGTLGFVSKFPVTGTAAQTHASKTYEYVLELDSQGNIIGGEWISLTRPDMLWMKRKDEQFLNGRFPLAGLNTIYKPVKR